MFHLGGVEAPVVISEISVETGNSRRTQTGHAYAGGEMIYVTVGTMFLDFKRLIEKMDDIANKTQERVIIQTGLGTTFPKHCEHFDFKPREEVMALQCEARVIVCHAGIGSVLDALEARRPLIVVPRRKQYHEHMNDHQLDLAEGIRMRGWGRAVHDVNDLEDACANPPAPPPDSYQSSKHRLVSAVREFVERTAAMRR